MMISMFGTSSKASVWLAVLPTFGLNGLNVDDAWLKSERFLTSWKLFPGLQMEIHQFCL